MNKRILKNQIASHLSKALKCKQTSDHQETLKAQTKVQSLKRKKSKQNLNHKKALKNFKKL
jgi:hypothetical protein